MNHKGRIAGWGWMILQMTRTVASRMSRGAVSRQNYHEKYYMLLGFNRRSGELLAVIDVTGEDP